VKKLCGLELIWCLVGSPLSWSAKYYFMNLVTVEGKPSVSGQCSFREHGTTTQQCSRASRFVSFYAAPVVKITCCQ
jgi:hypothetical protein